MLTPEFDSLTLALEDWFDKNLEGLPLTLRKRVEQELFPLPWNDMSADQRRSAALQWDYQHDPATEEERQYWWNFFQDLHELEAQVVHWKSVETPTANDLALKESRLKELQQEIDSMNLQLRQPHGDYYPGRKRIDTNRLEPDQNVPSAIVGRPKSPLAEAVEKVYLHFHDKGDVAILQPGNIKIFLKVLKNLADDEDLIPGSGNWNISSYIAERIKEVKTPREGEYSVITQDRREGRKLKPGRKYHQKAIAKLLSDLRNKYPLPS